MHGAIYDAVTAIDRTHKPYLVRLSASHFVSQEAAAAAAAHQGLVNCIPTSRQRSMLNFSRRWRNFQTEARLTAEADPNRLPEVGNTTPDPSYPGAHAVISAAGAEVLVSFSTTTISSSA
jgi:hypothetical protein